METPAMSEESEKCLHDTLARLERELDHLRQGLSLLGVKPCARCRKFFRLSDAGALFDCGDVACCYECIHEWWSQRCGELSLKDRKIVEHKLVRWLMAHHDAHIVHDLGKMPKDSPQALRMVADCLECSGTGILLGERCRHCDGAGTAWVVLPDPA
jgi:hypothetical protein